jgi:hypothetical protein
MSKGFRLPFTCASIVVYSCPLGFEMWKIKSPKVKGLQKNSPTSFMLLCAIKIHFISKHIKFHTYKIFLLLSNIVNFISNNFFNNVLNFFDSSKVFSFDKPHLWPNNSKMVGFKTPTISFFKNSFHYRASLNNYQLNVVCKHAIF